MIFIVVQARNSSNPRGAACSGAPVRTCIYLAACSGSREVVESRVKGSYSSATPSSLHSFCLSLTKPVAVLTFLLRLEAVNFAGSACNPLSFPSLSFPAPPWPQLKASKLHFEVAACVANRCRPRQIVAKVLKPQNLIAAQLKAKDNWPI